MLTLRRGQIDAMGARQWLEFEGDLARHLGEFFPDECAAAGGEAAVRELIRHGVARAERYGLVGRRDLFLYLDLMMALGRDFDTSPEMPWIEEALTDPDLPGPSERLAALYDAVIRLARGADPTPP
jgi:hypothetical protein